MYIVNLYNIKWKQKYTQEEIAKATKLSINTVNNLFSGEHHNFGIYTLEKICKFFNCSIHDILIEVPDKK